MEVDRSPDQSSTMSFEEYSDWAAYGTKRCFSKRNRLIARYRGFAESVAYGLSVQYRSAGVTADDCVQLSMLGLIKAIGRFDANKGVKFETFAYRYVKGEVLRGVEKYNEQLSYTCHKKRLEYERNQSLIKHKVKSIDRLVGVVANLGVAYLLDESCQPDDDGCSSVYGESLEGKMLVIQLLRRCGDLPERNRELLNLVYFHELSFAEVAKHLELSKTRVFQLHAESIDRLRRSMARSSDFEMNA